MSRNKFFSRLHCAKGREMRLVAAALLAAGALPLMGSALIDPSTIQSKETEYTTVQAEYGSISKTISSNVSIVYPKKVDVRCKMSNARVAEISLSRTDTLEEGMKLGVLSSNNSQADLAATQLSLSRAQEALEDGVRSREEAIAEKQTTIQSLSGAAREIGRLELQKMQIELEDYKTRQERSIAQLQKQADEQTEALQDQTLYSPTDGKLSYFSYVNQGDSLYYNQVLLTLECQTPYLLRIEDAGEWRYGMEVTLEYGPHNNRSSCKARIVSADNILAHASRTGYAYAIVEDDINPEDLTLPTVTGEYFHLDNVLLISKRAVTLNGGQSQVTLLEDSSIANRYVNVGLSNTESSWVVQGLEEGQILILD